MRNARGLAIWAKTAGTVAGCLRRCSRDAIPPFTFPRNLRFEAKAAGEARAGCTTRDAATATLTDFLGGPILRLEFTTGARPAP